MRAPELPLHSWPRGRPGDDVQSHLQDEDLDLEIQKLPEAKQDSARQRIRTWEDAIQPHTEEGGSSVYVGDAYGQIDATCAAEWSVKSPRPYLRYLKLLSRNWPHLEWLTHWMEVTCHPAKWRFLRRFPDARAERARRTNVCLIDYADGGDPAVSFAKTLAALDEILLRTPTEQHHTRLVIVEDLSRDVVEALGWHYKVDPLFFRSQIDDYLFNLVRDRWAEPPKLAVNARHHPWLTLSYLRPRYFPTEVDFTNAEQESGKFNVLRRLDSDRSRQSLQGGPLDSPTASVTLMRSKASLWVKPQRANETNVVILLLDPTVAQGSPLWGGHERFDATPGPASNIETTDPASVGRPGVSLFEEACHWYGKAQYSRCRDSVDSFDLGLPMYKLVVSEWLTIVKYMDAVVGTSEWDIARPNFGRNEDDASGVLKRLAHWRRNIHYYERMIGQSIEEIFIIAREASNSDAGNCRDRRLLQIDFQRALNGMQQVRRRMDELAMKISSGLEIESNRKAANALQQGNNTTLLTTFATIFLPLNLVTSFLSMSPNFSTSSNTFWLFFAIGAPLTLLVMLVVLAVVSRGPLKRLFARIIPK